MTSRQRLLEIHGSEEAVSKYFRDLQKKSRKTYKGTGGMAWLKKNDPKKLKRIARQGGLNSGKSKSN